MKRSVMRFAFCIFLILTLSSPLVFSQNHSDVERLVQGNTQFAIELYNRLKTTGAGNLFFSPYSISTAASMTYGGAVGDTARQMVDVFHFSLEDEKLHSAFAQIQSRLNLIQRQNKIELHIANALWPQDKYPLLNEYLELIRKCYGAEIEPVDYDRNPNAVRRRINAWVERKTKNRIQNMIPDAGLLAPPTRLVLANAIYFKGDWASRFDKSFTEEMPFHPNRNETINVPIMMQTSDFKYGEDEIVQVLEMPYTGSELSMVIVLPRELDGLPNVEERLAVNSLKDWNKCSYENPVDVYLPRLRMTYQLNLKDVLEAMGMTDAFDCSKANFAGMDGVPNWLYIGFAMHKAFVDVNEEGTEAAAATAGGCFPAGTEVLTVDGPRAIETIEVGEKVFAWDLLTGDWITTQVFERKAQQYDGDMIAIQSGSILIEATGNHPFYVLRGDNLASRPLPEDVPRAEEGIMEQGRWVEARDLEAGDLLMAKDGEGLIVTSLSSRPEKTVVYNLGVDGCHNYAVHRKGILVHNKGAAQPEAKIFRADHPFLFLIRDNGTGSILFMGRVVHPLTK